MFGSVLQRAEIEQNINFVNGSCFKIQMRTTIQLCTFGIPDKVHFWLMIRIRIGNKIDIREKDPDTIYE